MCKDTHYQVSCQHCGRVWEPPVRSALWWKARKRAEKGFIDAYITTPKECGCEEEIWKPDSLFRVQWFDDMCYEYDEPFTWFVDAARRYLELSRDFMCTAVFVDNRTWGLPKTVERLDEIAGRW